MQNMCRRIFILNIKLKKHVIDNIMSVHMNLHEFMCRYEVKITLNKNNIFK
jgi:hypothetical protein